MTGVLGRFLGRNRDGECRYESGAQKQLGRAIEGQVERSFVIQGPWHNLLHNRAFEYDRLGERSFNVIFEWNRK
jgi:hypothetical protein